MFFFSLFVPTLTKNACKKNIAIKEVFIPFEDPKQKKEVVVQATKTVVNTKSKQKPSKKRKKVSSSLKISADKESQELEKLLSSWDTIFTQATSATISSTEIELPAKISLELTKQEEKDLYPLQILACIEKTITLPEKGKAKLSLSISNEGKLFEVNILSSSSEKISTFLKKRLPNLKFPCFNDVAVRQVVINVIAN